MEGPVRNPSVPYIGPICRGKFIPEKMVKVQGTVASVAYRFNINLQCVPEIHSQSDIAVQVSVRLLDGCITLNSLENGIWGEERRGVTCPIKCAEKFEVVLLCDFNQYKVAINGRHYCEFPQRIHYNRITHLAINGDVSIAQISYESGGAVDSTRDDFEIIDPAEVLFPKSHSTAFTPGFIHVLPNRTAAYDKATPLQFNASGINTYPLNKLPGALGIPPPPPKSAPVPFIVRSSDSQSRKMPSGIKCFGVCLFIILSITVIVATVILKVNEGIERYHQSPNTHYSVANDGKKIDYKS